MRLPYRNKKATIWILLGVVVLTMFLFKFTELRPTCLFSNNNDSNSGMMIRSEKFVVGANQQAYSYNRQMPLIFIGGVPRSGTTLMRAMLDAHPDVRCGQETRVIPRILQLRSHWMKSEKESLRLVEAGITTEVMNSAIAQFCLEIIAKHGEPAPRLCNKDPLTLKMGTYVIELFPNAKFLFMVRDGRATVHSIISRKVTITGFDLTSYRQCMQKWNHAIEVMHNQCKEIGKDRCMMVYYEQLVLHPGEWMRKILKFLDIPWNDAVLHHEEFINKPNGVPLSKVERSSDQVIKPVNLEALTKWVGQIPDDVVRDMPDIAPMLSVLGYDPYSNPPDYGKPDAWVQDNTYKLKVQANMWERRTQEILNLERNDAKNYYDAYNNDNKNNANNNGKSNLAYDVQKSKEIIKIKQLNEDKVKSKRKHTNNNNNYVDDDQEENLSKGNKVHNNQNKMNNKSRQSPVGDIGDEEELQQHQYQYQKQSSRT